MAKVIHHTEGPEISDRQQCIMPTSFWLSARGIANDSGLRTAYKVFPYVENSVSADSKSG